MDKFAWMALLYDFYSPLLTPKQRESLDLYYQQDLSLGEIAEENGISRQAVHDLLKRSEKILLQYEEKLTLVDRHLERQEKLHKLCSFLSRTEFDASTVANARLMVEELLAKD